ncbi:NADPH-dependent F420 reductase [Lignipirellula cremea]|uniref:2-dehydropantoate 2-reductase n=1 Tax=Lignipirellula cremea TaxID=2528010 RepID=A0A518DXE4_9BACT|nr:NADPH-dependent F420 reductase [Lignipirellula cremea]QDU96505.1 2-dehydropantoate 2-reductase [Lignipirellula cremea]
MKIGVLGTGHVGGTLGARWAQNGHDVLFGSRDPQSEKAARLMETAGESARIGSVAEAASHGDVVLLASPWSTIQETIEAAGDLSGKVVIDCINPINATFTGLDLGHTESGAEKIAEWAPGAKVVKAFNTVSAATMKDADYGEHQAAVFFCGDDEGAKETVRQLAEELGLDPVDSGELAMARYLEPFAMLYIKVAIGQKWGGNFAFKVLRR